MKRVISNILSCKKNSLNLVADWFEPKSHNHDYVSKIAKSNKIKLTKIMPKEETIYLFRSNSIRLQLVELRTMPQYKYQIRQNRIIKLTTYDRNMALARFKSLVSSMTQQLSMFN